MFPRVIELDIKIEGMWNTNILNNRLKKHAYCKIIFFFFNFMN